MENPDWLVDIRCSRHCGIIDRFVDDQFSIHKSGIGKPGKEFKNRINLGHVQKLF